MWFSFLDTPPVNSRSKHPDTFDCQVMIGRSYRKGFLGVDEPLDMQSEDSLRLALMKDSRGLGRAFPGVCYRELVRHICAV